MLNRNLGYPRVWYEPQELRADLLHIQELLSATVANHASLLSASWAADFQSRADRLRQDLGNPFTLAVVGSFKRGKSTLINALVGAPVVTTNVTPETITINRLSYGEPHQITALLADGGRIHLEELDLHAERLEPLMQALPQSIVRLDIRMPAEGLRGIQIVDTPGLGDLARQYDELVLDYLPQADAILLVISAQAPFAQDEQLFLREAILPQEFSRICCVVNRLDTLRNAADAERVLDVVETRIKQVLPGVTVFGISALDEVCRQHDQPRPQPDRADELAKRFEALRNHLENAILFNRDLIQIERAALRLEALRSDLSLRIQQFRIALENDGHQIGYSIQLHQEQQMELSAHIEQQRQQFRAFMAERQAEAVDWLSEFVDRLRVESIDRLREYSVDDVQRHFQFFLTDVCRDALMHCIETHEDSIRAAAASIGDSILNEMRSLNLVTLHIERSVAQINMAEERWTTFDTMQSAVLTLPIHLGGILQDVIISAGLSLIAGKLQGEKQVRTYQTKLLSALPQLSTMLTAEARHLYDEITAQIDLQIEDMYNREIKATLTALQQAQVIRDHFAQETGRVDHMLATLTAASDDAERQMTTLNAKLNHTLG